MADDVTFSRARWLPVAFYGVIGSVMLMILFGLHTEWLPGRFAGRLGYNSEGYLFALLLAAWIQYIRPWLRIDRQVIALCAAFVSFAIGMWLLGSDYPSRVRTLNETVFGLAFVIPYVSLPRPLPRWAPLLSLPLIVFVGLAVWADTNHWVVDQAETLGFIAIAIPAFDLVDRGILDRSAVTSPKLRWGAYGLFLAVPVVVSALGTGRREGGGFVADTLLYVGRIHEAWFGVLLVMLYFAVGLGWTGAGRNDTASNLVDGEPRLHKENAIL